MVSSAGRPCSPHPRGWSPPGQAVGGRGPLLPAPAGMATAGCRDATAGPSARLDTEKAAPHKHRVPVSKPTGTHERSRLGLHRTTMDGAGAKTSTSKPPQVGRASTDRVPDEEVVGSNPATPTEKYQVRSLIRIAGRAPE